MTSTTATLARQDARPPVVLPGPVRSDRVSATVDGLAVISLVAVWLVVHTMLLGGISESRAQATLYSRLRTELASGTAPTGGIITPGSPVALLKIPAIGVNSVVVEGTASGDLLGGPGHRRDTALPGQPGVSLIYGRARTYGAPFDDVPRLALGESIIVRTAQGKATFRVDSIRRAGDPLPQPLAAGAGRLTLVTAEGSGRLSALTAGSTVYVDATLIGKAFASPGGRLAAVPADEHAMGTDSAALPLLIVYLGAVLAAVSGAVVAARRWPGALVWVVTAPVVLALAWGTTDVASRLLPNLL
jgi:sortase A